MPKRPASSRSPRARTLTAKHACLADHADGVAIVLYGQRQQRRLERHPRELVGGELVVYAELCAGAVVLMVIGTDDEWPAWKGRLVRYGVDPDEPATPFRSALAHEREFGFLVDI